MKNLDRPLASGWIAVGISTAITCFWAFWGAIENFHEGWYYASLLPNIGLMFAQYLSPMLVFMTVTMVSLRWPRIGGGLHVVFALLAAWFFDALANTVLLLLIAPLIGLGALHYFGRPRPLRLALVAAVGLPVLTMILSGIEPVLRVSRRLDDGDRQARVVEGSGLSLTWAPEGPGWPLSGQDWHAARQVCQHLSADGLSSQPSPQGIWRLPTVDEAVRSMARHGQNSGGVWDAATGQTDYQTKPDKESPLWSTTSQVIYWWTATEVDEDQAYIIVYDGRVWPRQKDFGPAYLGYRCVR